MEEIAAQESLKLTKWQQKMLKDMFGVTTTKMDIVEDLRQWLMYRPAPHELLTNLRVQRMYLEEDQKAHLAKAMGIKAANMCDYLELDPEVIVKYAAMQRHPVLYGAAMKSD